MACWQSARVCRVVTVFTSAWLVTAGCFAANVPLIPTHLRCEYLVNPLGIHVEKPRLSWVLQSDTRGQQQTAYRILVGQSKNMLASDRGDLWDSGKVASDQQLHIEYSGKPLTSRMWCYWKVRVWDQDGEASPWSEPAMWSMGLLEPEDWQGQWIAGEEIEVREPHNGYHTEFANSPDAEKWVTVDLGEARRIDGVRLWPARPFNWQPDTPGFLFPVRFRVEVAGRTGFLRSTRGGGPDREDVPNPGTEAMTCRFEEVSGALRAPDGNPSARPETRTTTVWRWRNCRCWRATRIWR